MKTILSLGLLLAVCSYANAAEVDQVAAPAADPVWTCDVQYFNGLPGGTTLIKGDLVKHNINRNVYYDKAVAIPDVKDINDNNAKVLLMTFIDDSRQVNVQLRQMCFTDWQCAYERGAAVASLDAKGLQFEVTNVLKMDANGFTVSGNGTIQVTCKSTPGQ